MKKVYAFMIGDVKRTMSVIVYDKKTIKVPDNKHFSPN